MHVDILHQGLANFFCKEPDKYFRLCGYMVSITTTQATELCCSSAKAAIHNMESAWLSCNKTLFKKKSDKLDLAHRQWFAHPSSTSQIKAAKGKVHFWTFPPIP